MQRLFSMFPPGVPGYGLLILRLEVAVFLHLDGRGHLVQHSQSLVFAGLLALSVLILAGFLTPLVAALSATAEIVLMVASGTSIPLAAGIGPINSLLLILLGPGAYSLDAHLFGRRVLIFSSKDTPRQR